MKRFISLLVLFLTLASSVDAANSNFTIRDKSACPPLNSTDSVLIQTSDAGPYCHGEIEDLLAYVVINYGIGQITGLSAALDAKANTSALSAVALSGSYVDLSNKPSLFSGSYLDLTNKPSLFSGSYTDLTGKPSTFTPATHTHPESDVVNLTTDLAGKEPTLTAGTSSQYYRGDKTWQTHNAASITDSTTVGRNVLTASSAANARTAIGAGTSSFDGAYSSLTGVPSTFTPSTHSHAESDVTNLVTDLANRPIIYLNTTQKSSTRMLIKSGTVNASGNLIFYLTNDNLSTGTTLCPNGNVYTDSAMLRAIETDNPVLAGDGTLSNSNKTLTFPVKKTAQSFLSLLGLNVLTLPTSANANGTVVKMTILCD